MHIEELPITTISHLIKPEDTNHHGTLYAGRMADWAVESSFIGAQKILRVAPKFIVCLRIYGLTFKRPVHSGDVIDLRVRAAHIGTTSVTMYLDLLKSPDASPLLDGLLTFVRVNEEGRACPHGLDVEKPAAGGSLALWERAERLKQSQA